MKAVIQRVSEAILSVDGQTISLIKSGMVVFLGIESGDTKEQADYLAKKLVNLRIFNDNKDKMNLSVTAIDGEILLVSQFTLCADVSQGNRPSFVFAEEPSRALELYNYTIEQIKLLHPKIKTGIFGASMQITQTNQGPVTIIIQT